jgi:hypothetical protein
LGTPRGRQHEDLPSAIRDRGSCIRNNSDRTARVYEKRDHSSRWVCVTRSGGSIHDLRGYNLNDQTRSLKINRNDWADQPRPDGPAVPVPAHPHGDCRDLRGGPTPTDTGTWPGPQCPVGQ